MVNATEEPVQVSYEGLGPSAGREIMGSTQVYFLVRAPGHHAREVSVSLNDPAAEWLAGLAGVDPTDAFRATAARLAGTAWIEETLGSGRHLEAVVVLSRSRLEGDPKLVERLREALKEA
jgi:hypothetical protein